MTRKAFRVDEANALIPALNEVFQDVRAHRHAIREATQRIDVLDLLFFLEVSREPRHLAPPLHGWPPQGLLDEIRE